MSALEKIMGWLAPPTCISCGVEGLTLCLSCSEAGIIPFGERCFNCNALSSKGRTCDKCRSFGFPRHVWVSTDYENIAKELVQTYKFGQQRIAGVSIANPMIETLLSYNSDEDVLAANYLVVPIPTATSRVRQRGFDHSARLANIIAKKLEMKNTNVLKRLGQDRQVGKSRAERFKQAEGKYLITKLQIVTGRNILLIDDVATTGATLSSAAKALRKAGAKRVDALVFAKRI